jgi:hypothetical protein
MTDYKYDEDIREIGVADVKPTKKKIKRTVTIF